MLRVPGAASENTHHSVVSTGSTVVRGMARFGRLHQWMTVSHYVESKLCCHCIFVQVQRLDADAAALDIIWTLYVSVGAYWQLRFWALVLYTHAYGQIEAITDLSIHVCMYTYIVV